MSLDLNSFHTIVNEEAALRGRATLQPIGDDGDKVFPPSHSIGDDQAERRLRAERKFGAKYAWEWRRFGNTEKACVLLDSVQSQANRMEESLQRLWLAKKIALPVVTIDFGDKHPDLKAITSLTAPHRISDALLRDSLLVGTLFRHSELGKYFANATLADASSVFKVCPTALVFGLWDSTGPRGGLGFKIARNLTSEIVGIGAVPGQKTASRIDPTGIVKSPGDLTIWKADSERAPQDQWVLDEALALKDKEGKSVKYGKKDKAGKTTGINHSNIPPTLDLLAGGVTMEHADQTVVFSLSGLRRLAFGGSDEDDQKARTVLAALGLVAVLAAVENPGYFLRSRCHLSPKPKGALAFKRIDRKGAEEPLEIDKDIAIDIYDQAVNELPKHLAWYPWKVNGWSEQKLKKGEPIAKLTPAPKLMALIEKSRELGAAMEDEEAAPDAGAGA
ncbi:MAG: type I-U CRISPR-associated protein Cas7 [Betaproteobacteria bacterium]|nr:type I-U CRISPR-associated protein Cas7 [Betaproteobacteria bacterium]